MAGSATSGNQLGRRLAHFLLTHSAEVLLAALVLAIAGYFGNQTRPGQWVKRHTLWAKSSSSMAQLNAVIHYEAVHHMMRTYNESVDFRGTGAPSDTRVVIFAPTRDNRPFPSDELRIYDMSRDKLGQPLLQFRPLPATKSPFIQGTYPLQIRVIRRQTLATNGEIVLVISLDMVGTWLRHPAVIRWDAADERFKIQPLLPPTIVGSKDLAAPRLVRASQERYASQPLIAVDRVNGISFKDYGADEFNVAQLSEPLGLTLTGGYRINPAADRPTVQIDRWIVAVPARDAPKAALCPATVPLLVRAPSRDIRPTVQSRKLSPVEALKCGAGTS